MLCKLIEAVVQSMNDHLLKNRRLVILSAAFIFLPALLFSVISLAQCGGSGGGLFLPMPVWNGKTLAGDGNAERVLGI